MGHKEHSQQHSNDFVSGHGHWTCGDYFKMYSNIKLLCCTPKTNVTLDMNDISTFKKMADGMLKWEIRQLLWVEMENIFLYV